MIIKTSNKEYIGQCNALSYIFHNRLFKKNIIEELIELRKCFIELDKKEVTEKVIESIYNILTRIMYTLLYTYNSKICSFTDFKKEITEEVISNETINEIIELLMENFTDIEVSKQLEKINSNNTEKSIFPEHEFLVTCLQLKLTIQDLKILSYIDIMKMFVLTLNLGKEENKEFNYKKATQSDIDRFLM